MVWDRLRVSVDGVECMAREWRRDDPFVMRLMDVFVQEGNMEPAVDPVNAVVGKKEEPD